MNRNVLIKEEKWIYGIVFIIIVALFVALFMIPTYNTKKNTFELKLMTIDKETKENITFGYYLYRGDILISENHESKKEHIIKIEKSPSAYNLILISENYYPSRGILIVANNSFIKNLTEQEKTYEMFKIGKLDIEEKGGIQNNKSTQINLTINSNGLFQDAFACIRTSTQNINVTSNYVYTTKLPLAVKDKNYFQGCFIIYNKMENNQVNLSLYSSSKNLTENDFLHIIFFDHLWRYYNGTWKYTYNDESRNYIQITPEIERIVKIK